MWEGTVVSINIAQKAAAAMQSIVEVRAIPGRGLEGDRYFAGTGYYSKTSSHGGREVTLIEIETIEALFRGVLNAAGGRQESSSPPRTPAATLRPRVSH